MSEPSEIGERFSRRAAVVGGLLLSLAALLLLVPLPKLGQLGIALGDLLHGPGFFILTILVYHLFRSWLPRREWLAMLIVWVMMIVVGCSSEVMQDLVGRSGNWRDTVSDALGAAAALFWLRAASTENRNRRRTLHACMVSLLVLATISPALVILELARQHNDFPQLATFERTGELNRWRRPFCRMERSGKFATEGDWALKATLVPSTYPGFALEPPSDWSEYDELVFDIAGGDPPDEVFADSDLLAEPDTLPLQLIIKIEDKDHNKEPEDRFHYEVHLTREMTEVRIPLADVRAAPLGREMNMNRILRISFFFIRPKETKVVYLDNLRLE